MKQIFNIKLVLFVFFHIIHIEFVRKMNHNLAFDPDITPYTYHTSIVLWLTEYHYSLSLLLLVLKMYAIVINFVLIK